MSMMYIGSVMFFEKKESTISTMLVTPSTHSEMILSKVFANTIHNVLSSGLVILVFVFIKDIHVNAITIIISLVVISSFHTILGLYLSYFQKDFTSLIMTISVFSMLLLIPTLLISLNVIQGQFWEYLLLINPVNASNVMILNSFMVQPINLQFIISFSYLLILGFCLYRYFALPQFKNYAISISGV